MKIYIPLILSTILVLTSCSEEPVSLRKKYYKTYSTEAGNITVKDDIIVTLEGEKTSELAFRSAGIISDISVLPGESVKKGQIIARLGNRESGIQIDALSNIQGELNTLLDTTESIKISSAGMEEKTRKLYDEQIKSLDIEIEGLKITLEQAKQNLENQNTGVNTSFMTFLSDFDRIATAMLDEGDVILGMTTVHEDRADDWAGNLGVYVGDTREAAKNTWNALYSLRSEIRNYTETIAKAGGISPDLKKLTDAYRVIREYAVSMNYMLQNSVVGADLSEIQLNSWKSMWKGLASDGQNSETQYTNWKNSVQNITNTKSGSGSVAEKDITQLELSLKKVRQSRLTLLAEKETRLQEIQTNIQTIEGKKGEVGLKTAETKMNTALAKESIEYNYIRAPFDGIILEKHFEEGMNIGAGTPLLKISTRDRIIIKTYIDNTLYTYKVGDPITIRDESGLYSTGSVGLIQEQKDPLYNKNYMEVILSGEYTLGSKVTLELERKKASFQNGTLVPLSSIIHRYGPPGVYLLDQGIARFQIIEILRADMSHAEVLGIPPGAEIITDGKENIYDGEKLDI